MYSLVAADRASGLGGEESEGASMAGLTHRVERIPVATREDARGTVTAARDLSVRAGLGMYDVGGNAVDAAVATALVAGVIEPTETTLAGCGFMLIQHPDLGAISVDFGPLAPLGASPDMFEIDEDAQSSNVLGLVSVVGNANVSGPRASGVPRTLYALLEAQERWGNLSRAQVVAPAIQAAEEGFRADTWFVVNAMQDLELLAKDPGCSSTFLEADGLPIGRRSAFAYGTSVDTAPRVRQPQLARTLRTVSDLGQRDLIDGELGRLLAETFSDSGMVLTGEDLKRMPPRIESPRQTRFLDATVAVPRAPGGGLSVLQALNVWQRLAAQVGELAKPQQLLYLSRVLRHVFADRYHWLGDPEIKDIPTDALLSDEYADYLATFCLENAWEPAKIDGAPWNYFSDVALHNPWKYSSRSAWLEWHSGGGTDPSSGTTHVSAADADGLVVAITHTAANHFGSAVMCPRTGLLFDSSMAWFNAKPGAANSISAGGRPVANMAPALIFDHRSGGAWALGASGGRRIISAVVQLVREIVEEGRDISEALSRPRIDASGNSVVVHEFDASFAAEHVELDATVVPQHSLAFELDFARANIAQSIPGRGTISAIEARAFDE